MLIFGDGGAFPNMIVAILFTTSSLDQLIQIHYFPLEMGRFPSSIRCAEKKATVMLDYSRFPNQLLFLHLYSECIRIFNLSSYYVTIDRKIRWSSDSKLGLKKSPALIISVTFVPKKDIHLQEFPNTRELLSIDRFIFQQTERKRHSTNENENLLAL